MKILKYDNFVFDNKIFDFINESKIFYSEKFIEVLNKMKNNYIAENLLKIYSQDIDRLTYNYVDTSNTNDKVQFTNDRKAQEFLKDQPDLYKVVMSNKCLTHSKTNDKIFEKIGYDKQNNTFWSPSLGTVGEILNESIGTTGKIYCLFKEYDVEQPKITVINKVALESSYNNKIWSNNRNPVSVGKLARSILISANIQFTTKQLEDFVNLYKSTYDFIQDKLKQFNIVKGRDISYWYDGDNYDNNGGTLNNSCMSQVNEDYFDVYTSNKNVSLVILYDDNGSIKEDGSYQSSLIKGRALLWNCKLNGVDITFMDRIYTTYDSDVNLFIQFAQKNGWWYKISQTMDPYETISNGKENKNGRLEVSLENTDCQEYPYMDTLCYISVYNGFASNSPEGAERECRSTSGYYEYIGED